MLCSVVVILNTLNTPLVAYSCRFYYPPGDTRTSYHQIYISDLHGHHREQLTTSPSEKTRIQWAGPNKLCWVESIGVSARETDYGYHTPKESGTDISKREKLVLYDLKSGKQKTLGYGLFRLDGDYRGPYHSTTKYASYIQYRERIVKGSYTDTNLHWVKISPTKVTWKPYNVDEHSLGLKSEIWDGVKFDKPPVESDKEFRYGSSGNSGTDGATQWISRLGKSVFVPREIDRVWVSPDKSQCWFQVGSYAGSGGCDQYVHRINWKTGIRTLVADEVLDIDFHPEQPYWAASSNNKGTTKLGNIVVWRRELWCGSIYSGEQWKLASGAVHGDSAVVRP